MHDCLLEHYPNIMPFADQVLVDVVGVIFGAAIVAGWIKMYIPKEVHAISF
jgi:hypothetical protein